jgi:hypothetical protein
MKPAYKMIGIFDDVEVFHRGDGRRIELSAVGDITAPPALVHSMLLSHTNPRVIASLAEGWAAGVCPPMHKFTLNARWSMQGSPGLSFKLLDDRGAVTRPTNWVTAIEGSWSFEPIQDGLWSWAIFHVAIDYASPVATSTIRLNALNDLPALFQTLRALVGDHRPVHRAAANSG